MTNHDKNLILQACAFAQAFLKEADRAVAGHASQTHEAAVQLAAALYDLPPAIEGCSCNCVEFNRAPSEEASAVLINLPSFQRYERIRNGH
jgi:hypothetical protein